MPVVSAAVVANAAICDERNVDSVLKSSQSGVTPLWLMVVTETYVFLRSDASRRHILSIGLVVGSATGCHNLFFVFSFASSLRSLIFQGRVTCMGENRNS